MSSSFSFAESRKTKIEAIKADIEALNVLRAGLNDALASGLITQNDYKEQLKKLFDMVDNNRELLSKLYNEA